MSEVKPAETRLDWLDALRGWAILMVVLTHSGQIVRGLDGVTRQIADAGQYGVQLFFVVSALTIFHTYRSQLARATDRISATLAWWTKRGFRIAPLYYYGIALYFVAYTAVRHLGSNIPGYSWLDAVSNVLFFHSWMNSAAQNGVVPGGWSIGAEMVFYLIAPWLFTRLRTPSAAVIAFLLSLLGVSALDWMMSVQLDGRSFVANDTFLYFWFPTQLPAFLAGFAFYRLAGQRLWNGATPPLWVEPLALSGFLGFGALGLELGSVGELDNALAPAAFGLAFCCLVLMAMGRLRPLLANITTVFLGRISYSLYINHFLVVYVMKHYDQQYGFLPRLPHAWALSGVFIETVALASIMSVFTYHLIERPGIEAGRRLANRISARWETRVSRRRVTA